MLLDQLRGRIATAIFNILKSIAHNGAFTAREMLSSLLPTMAIPLSYDFQDEVRVLNEFDARLFIFDEKRIEAAPNSNVTDENFSFVADGNMVQAKLRALMPEDSSLEGCARLLDMSHDRPSYRPVVSSTVTAAMTLNTPSLGGYFAETAEQIHYLQEKVEEDKREIDRLTFLAEYNLVERTPHEHNLRGGHLSPYFVDALPADQRRRSRTLSSVQEMSRLHIEELKNLLDERSFKLERLRTFEVINFRKAIEDVVDYLDFAFSATTHRHAHSAVPTYMSTMACRQGADVCKLFVNTMKAMCNFERDQVMPPAHFANFSYDVIPMDTQ